MNYQTIIILTVILIMLILIFLYKNGYSIYKTNIYINDLKYMITSFNLDHFLTNIKLNINKFNKNKYILDTLPILSPYNKNLYPLWHKYYEKVYNQPVETIIDLNTFNWFYWDCPIDNIKENINVFIKPSIIKTCNTCKNMPYILRDSFVKCPEDMASNIGFFVNKDIKIDKNIGKIEVFRVDNYEVGFEGHLELYCKWFWITKGSGKFIDIEMDKTLILKDRDDWKYNIPFNECTKEAWALLKSKNIKYVIFTDSFSDDADNNQGRPELVIVR